MWGSCIGSSALYPPVLAFHAAESWCVQERVISNLAEYGNTSAASIPLALDEAVRAGSIKPGDVVSARSCVTAPNAQR